MNWFRHAGLIRNVKWFIQRGRRGWADCDVWSLDTYLAQWLPDALRRLKDNGSGYPATLVPAEYLGESLTEEQSEQYQKEWNALLDRMIEAFEAYQRIEGALYEAELGEYPYHRPSNIAPQDWQTTIDARHKEIDNLVRRDIEIFESGMRVFVGYYGALWD